MLIRSKRYTEQQSYFIREALVWLETKSICARKYER